MESEQSKSKLQMILPVAIVLVILLAGLGTGYLLNQNKVFSSKNQLVETKTEVGSKDTKVFKDTASGLIEAGGLAGEGTHKLIREGGPSQTVYLTSSVIDLDQFVGKKVEIWGETFTGQKAAWLMDVGRIKIAD